MGGVMRHKNRLGPLDTKWHSLLLVSYSFKNQQFTECLICAKPIIISEIKNISKSVFSISTISKRVHGLSGWVLDWRLFHSCWVNICIKRYACCKETCQWRALSRIKWAAKFMSNFKSAFLSLICNLLFQILFG